MPKKLTTAEEIQQAWEKKRERDKKAQATWVQKNHDVHLQRMKEQYQKKKQKKADEKKAGKEREMMAMEDRDAPAPPPPPKKVVRRIRVAVPVDRPVADAPIHERVKAYKVANPQATQRQIAEHFKVAQSTINRYLKK